MSVTIAGVRRDEVAAWAAHAPVEALLRPLLAGLEVEALSRDGKLDLAVGLDRLGGYVAAPPPRRQHTLDQPHRPPLPETPATLPLDHTRPKISDDPPPF